MGIGCAGEARARRVVRPTRYSWRREVHTVGRPNHARWLLGAVLALAATLAVPRDGQTQMGGTPAQGAQSQSQGAGAAPPFDLKDRSEEHTSELQSQSNLVCRLLLEKKKKKSM